MNENLEKMELDELDEVTGGKGGDGMHRGAIIVKNSAGANIRRQMNSKSKKLGHYAQGAILNGAKDCGKGVEGYSWYKVPAQGGKPAGYIAKHLTKLV